MHPESNNPALERRLICSLQGKCLKAKKEKGKVAAAAKAMHQDIGMHSQNRALAASYAVVEFLKEVSPCSSLP
jgi:hypothetical protein